MIQNLVRHKNFGAKKEAVGELVFTTSVIGYMETLTDPSYFGQVVLQTFPLVGNYGVIPSDVESGTPVLNAYVVRDWCQVPSNFRSDGELDTFLKTNNIPGLYDIDTRALTKIIREKGVMNCKLCYSLDNKEKDLEEILQSEGGYFCCLNLATPCIAGKVNGRSFENRAIESQSFCVYERSRQVRQQRIG